MTAQELADMAHPSWQLRGDSLYYGDTRRGAGVMLFPYEVYCWDGPGFLFDECCEELRAVVVAQTDPEAFIEEYAKRKRRGGE